jgi:hypothetical protein
MPKLKKLELQRNPLTVEGISSLLQEMVNTKLSATIKSLTFTSIPLGDVGIQKVLDLVANHFPELTYLNLTACRASSKTI